MKAISLYIFLILFTIISCKPQGPKLEALDLLSQGLALKISAPPNVEIVASDLGILKDVTVKNDEGFSLQIFESEARILDAAKVTSDLKSEIENSKYFSKFISSEDHGFIFEKKIDENYTNYDFRHVKVRGDKQYVIQAGISVQYTLDQVKLMYKSVQ